MNDVNISSPWRQTPAIVINLTVHNHAMVDCSNDNQTTAASAAAANGGDAIIRNPPPSLPPPPPPPPSAAPDLARVLSFDKPSNDDNRSYNDISLDDVVDDDDDDDLAFLTDGLRKDLAAADDFLNNFQAEMENLELSPRNKPEESLKMNGIPDIAIPPIDDDDDEESILTAPDATMTMPIISPQDATSEHNFFSPCSDHLGPFDTAAGSLCKSNLADKYPTMTAAKMKALSPYFDEGRDGKVVARSLARELDLMDDQRPFDEVVESGVAMGDEQRVMEGGVELEKANDVSTYDELQQTVCSVDLPEPMEKDVSAVISLLQTPQRDRETDANESFLTDEQQQEVEPVEQLPQEGNHCSADSSAPQSPGRDGETKGNETFEIPYDETAKSETKPPPSPDDDNDISQMDNSALFLPNANTSLNDTINDPITNVAPITDDTITEEQSKTIVAPTKDETDVDITSSNSPPSLVDESPTDDDILQFFPNRESALVTTRQTKKAVKKTDAPSSTASKSRLSLSKTPAAATDKRRSSIVPKTRTSLAPNRSSSALKGRTSLAPSTNRSSSVPKGRASMAPSTKRSVSAPKSRLSLTSKPTSEMTKTRKRLSTAATATTAAKPTTTTKPTFRSRAAGPIKTTTATKPTTTRSRSSLPVRSRVTPTTKTSPSDPTPQSLVKKTKATTPSTLLSPSKDSPATLAVKKAKMRIRQRAAERKKREESVRGRKSIIERAKKVRPETSKVKTGDKAKVTIGKDAEKEKVKKKVIKVKDEPLLINKENNSATVSEAPPTTKDAPSSNKENNSAKVSEAPSSNKENNSVIVTDAPPSPLSKSKDSPPPPSPSFIFGKPTPTPTPLKTPKPKLTIPIAPRLTLSERHGPKLPPKNTTTTTAIISNTTLLNTSTHSSKGPDSISTLTNLSSHRLLTVPIPPKLATAKNGEKPCPTMHTTPKAKESVIHYTPTLTQPQPFNLSHSKHVAASPSDGTLTLAETLFKLEQKGFRDINNNNTSMMSDAVVRPRVTQPVPFNLSVGNREVDGNAKVGEGYKTLAESLGLYERKGLREGEGPKKGYVGGRTEVMEFNLSKSRTEPKTPIPSTPTLAESLQLYERKGFRQSTPITSTPHHHHHTPTIPQSPKITKSTPKPIKTLSQLEDEALQYMATHQFKARPVNRSLLTGMSSVGVPKIPKKVLTTPEPFRLTTEKRGEMREEMEEGRRGVTREEIDEQECKKQFRARPIPDFSNRPPKQQTKPTQRKLTTPSPFKLSTPTTPKPAHSTPDDIELSKKFHARPMPTFNPGAGASPLVKQPLVQPQSPLLTMKDRASQRQSLINESRRKTLDKLKKRAQLSKKRQKARAAAAAVPPSSPLKPTQPLSFHLQTDRRGSTHKLLLEQKLQQEEEERRRLSIPKALPPPPPSQPFVPSKSTAPLTEPQPFSLKSLSRHDDYERHRQEQLRLAEEEKKRLSQVKALPLPSSTYTKPHTPLPPSQCGRAKLRTSPPHLHTTTQALHRKAFDDSVEKLQQSKKAMADAVRRQEEWEWEREMYAKKRMSVEEGGLIPVAKPVNAVFRERKGRVSVGCARERGLDDLIDGFDKVRLR